MKKKNQSGAYRGRRSYLNDFKVDENGNYGYTGSVYACENFRFVTYTLVIAVLIFMLSVANGIIPAAGTFDCFYQIIPLGFTVAFSGFMLYAAIKLNFAKKPIRQYIYDSTVTRLHRTFTECFVSATVSILTTILYLILNGFGNSVAFTVMYIAFDIVIIALSFVAKYIFKKAVFTKDVPEYVPQIDIL